MQNYKFKKPALG